MSIRLVSNTDTIGGRIQAERERLSLSRAALTGLLAATTDIQRTWERSEAFPDAIALARYADAGADVLFIVTGRRETRHPGTVAAMVRLLSGETAAAAAALEQRNILIEQLVGEWRQ